MQSKDSWGVITRHLTDVLQESTMLSCIWNVVVELSDLLIEAIVLLEDSISEPNCAIGTEKLSVKIISDSSTILHFTDHVLDGIPGVCAICCLTLRQVLINE